MTRNQEVATEILRQLGGQGRITAMTGAKNFFAIDEGLSFQLPRSSGNPYNHVRIVLTVMDLYDVKFIATRGNEIKKETSFDGLYFDMLKPIIEKETGLYLSI